MAFLHGKDGKVTVNSTERRVKSWEATFEDDLADVTSTGIPSGGTLAGFGEVIKGIRRCSGSFTFVLDGSAIPSFVEGDQVALTLLYTATVGWNFAKALIKSMAPKVGVDGAIEVTCSFQSHGEYATLP